MRFCCSAQRSTVTPQPRRARRRRRFRARERCRARCAGLDMRDAIVAAAALMADARATPLGLAKNEAMRDLLHTARWQWAGWAGLGLVLLNLARRRWPPAVGVGLALAAWAAAAWIGRVPWPFEAGNALVLGRESASLLSMPANFVIGLLVAALCLLAAAPWLRSGWATTPQKEGSILVYPGLVLLTGLGWLILLDLSANGHFSTRYLALYHQGHLWIGMMIFTLAAFVRQPLGRSLAWCLSLVDAAASRVGKHLGGLGSAALLLCLALLLTRPWRRFCSTCASSRRRSAACGSSSARRGSSFCAAHPLPSASREAAIRSFPLFSLHLAAAVRGRRARRGDGDHARYGTAAHRRLRRRCVRRSVGRDVALSTERRHRLRLRACGRFVRELDRRDDCRTLPAWRDRRRHRRAPRECRRAARVGQRSTGADHLVSARSALRRFRAGCGSVVRLWSFRRVRRRPGADSERLHVHGADWHAGLDRRVGRDAGLRHLALRRRSLSCACDPGRAAPAADWRAGLSTTSRRC